MYQVEYEVGPYEYETLNEDNECDYYFFNFLMTYSVEDDHWSAEVTTAKSDTGEIYTRSQVVALLGDLEVRLIEERHSSLWSPYDYR